MQLKGFLYGFERLFAVFPFIERFGQAPLGLPGFGVEVGVDPEDVDGRFQAFASAPRQDVPETAQFVYRLRQSFDLPGQAPVREVAVVQRPLVQPLRQAQVGFVVRRVAVAEDRQQVSFEREYGKFYDPARLGAFLREDEGRYAVDVPAPFLMGGRLFVHRGFGADGNERQPLLRKPDGVQQFGETRNFAAAVAAPAAQEDGCRVIRPVETFQFFHDRRVGFVVGIVLRVPLRVGFLLEIVEGAFPH